MGYKAIPGTLVLQGLQDSLATPARVEVPARQALLALQATLVHLARQAILVHLARQAIQATLALREAVPQGQRGRLAILARLALQGRLATLARLVLLGKE